MMGLEEDIGIGDITTDSIIDKKKIVKAQFMAKEDFVVAGLFIVKLVFQVLDKKIKFVEKVADGDRVKKGQIIAVVTGSAHSIIRGERLALNFLQRISGVATITSKFVEAVKGTNATILDTRKTTPLWRSIEKYGVLAGGGENHRFGLFDAVLIKDNHIKFAGGIEKAIEKVKRSKVFTNQKFKFIEVEAKNLDEVQKAITAGVDRILLDNMDLKTMSQAVKLCKKYKIKTEASGGVNLKTVRSIAKTGVDFISVGAITHSVRAVDINMKIV